MMKDYHVHSSFSDSSLTIEEIIDLAKQNGVKKLAIADHDTVLGAIKAMELTASDNGLQIIPAVEMSCYDYKYNKLVHILGFNYVLPAENISKLGSITLARRQHNSLWQIEQLRNSGLPINEELVKRELQEGKTIYKQHIMSALVKLDLADGISGETYKKYFKNDGIAKRDIVYPSVEECIEAIHADGGVAVLAHPCLSKLEGLLEHYVELGIDGLEAVHVYHTKDQATMLHHFAKKHQLIETYGSDNHGIFDPAPQIGVTGEFYDD